MLVRKWIRRLGFDCIRISPRQQFGTDHYTRHNARRLEHLASLRIPVAGMSVLEVGAGIGDHSSYYLDRGCRVLLTEARAGNIRCLKERYPMVEVQQLDLEHPRPLESGPFDVVHCYGLLYHLRDPAKALEYLGQNTAGHLFLETCVSFGDSQQIHPVAESPSNVTQAYSGQGCRPTRRWIFERLGSLFEYVYLPQTQPNHEEFPVDWTAPEQHRAHLARAVFIASRVRMDNPALASELLDRQTRHE